MISAPRREPLLRPLEHLAYLAIFAAVVALLYGRSVSYGFYWDDYHFIRPYSWPEVARAWIGPWDARDQIEAPFYRPLTIAFNAFRANVIGLHPALLHAMSLATLAVAAWLFVLWMRALDLTRSAAFTAAVLFVVHPFTSLSTALWITNQMHLLQLLFVLGALLVATRWPARWPTTLALQVAALLVKEDSIVLAPLIGVLWLLRGERIARGWLLATGIVLTAYVPLRFWSVGGWGGYPDEERGPLLSRILVGPAALAAPWPVVSLALLTLPALVVASWRNIRRSGLSALALAVVMLVLFNAPLALTPLSYAGPNRWHFMVMALCLAIAGCLTAIRSRLLATLGLIPVAVMMVPLIAENRVVLTVVHPCAEFTRQTDIWVLEWGDHVPTALRQQVLAKRCP